MKYIKTFEEINLKYNVGDCVILDMDKIKRINIEHNYDPGFNDPMDNIVQIIKLRKSEEDEYYQVEFYFGQDDDFYIIRDRDILREATPEEIEDFNEKKKVDKKMTKFNI